LAAYSHKIELVEKLIRVLEVLRDEPNGLSLHELAARTGYVKSSIHRILHSLKAHGYVDQASPGAPYGLGIQFLSLANTLATRVELVKLGRPYMRELVALFRESAYLAVLRDGKAVFVDVVDSARDFQLIGPLGTEVYFHASSAGKIFAAFLPPKQQEALLDSIELIPLTAHTLVDREAIAREWDSVRRSGWALNDEETIVGAAFLAAPVFDREGSICGSISVGVPKVRFPADVAADIAGHLKDACRRLSQDLVATGYVHAHGLDTSQAVTPPIPLRKAHYA